ncbi:MAG TPA: sigma-70 family RNA polymerase sigma factor [Candidatus Angelobacter sp.]
MKNQEEHAGQRQNGNITVFDPQRRPKGLMKPLSRSNGEVYLSALPVELYPFDEDYLRHLQQADGATQDHFVHYFTGILRIKLRSRSLAVDEMKDVLQETLLRVLVAVRVNDVRQPERLGAYVNSTCNNVLREHYREVSKNHCVDLDGVDVPDGGADLEGNMIAHERDKAVRAVLKKLSDKDSAVLRALLQERDKEEICRELGVDRGYLRVLTHRAIRNFKDQYEVRKVSRRFGRVAKP